MVRCQGAKGGGTYLVLTKRSGVAVGHEPRAVVVDAIVGREGASQGAEALRHRAIAAAQQWRTDDSRTSRVGTKAPVD